MVHLTGPSAQRLERMRRDTKGTPRGSNVVGIQPGPWLDTALARGLIRAADVVPRQRQPESATEIAAVILDGMSEKEFMSAVVALAKRNGFEVFHTFDARRSAPGLPDLLMCKPGTLIFAELKVGRNKTTAAQEKWLNLLATIDGVKVFRWRPEDWPVILETLTAVSCPRGREMGTDGIGAATREG